MTTTQKPNWRTDLQSFAQYVKSTHTVSAVAEYANHYVVMYSTGKRAMRKTIRKP